MAWPVPRSSVCNMPKSGAKRFACGGIARANDGAVARPAKGSNSVTGSPSSALTLSTNFASSASRPQSTSESIRADPPGSAANWFRAAAIVRRISAMRAGRGGRSPAKRVVRRKTVLPSLMTVRSVSSAKSSISSCGFPAPVAASSDAVSQGRSRIRRKVNPAAWQTFSIAVISAGAMAVTSTGLGPSLAVSIGRKSSRQRSSNSLNSRAAWKRTRSGRSSSAAGGTENCRNSIRVRPTETRTSGRPQPRASSSLAIRAEPFGRFLRGPARDSEGVFDRQLAAALRGDGNATFAGVPFDG